MRPTDQVDGVTEAELKVVLDALGAYSAPEPPPGAAEALVERLRAYVPAPPPTRRFRAEGLAAAPAELALGAMLGQARVLPWTWWAASALVALALPVLARLVGIAPALLFPPLVAASTAYAFRELGSPAMEIELTCPVRPAQVIIVRMMLVLGWIAGLGLLPTLLVAGGAGGAALAAWAAGLLLCGGAALLLTLWAGSWGGLILALGAWVGWLGWRVGQTQPLPPLGISNGAAAAAGLALIALALLTPGHLGRLPREEG